MNANLFSIHRPYVANATTENTPKCAGCEEDRQALKRVLLPAGLRMSAYMYVRMYVGVPRCT